VATCVVQREGLCVGNCTAASATFARDARVARSPRTGSPQAGEAEAASSAAGRSASSPAGSKLGSDGGRGELPRLFVLGCEACGSSSVASLLDVQPGVSLGWPLAGEPPWRADNPSFFSQEDLYARGARWYRAHFARRGAHDRTATWVDGSKGYLAAPFAAARLKLLLGPAGVAPKLVALLHDPTRAAVRRGA